MKQDRESDVPTGETGQERPVVWLRRFHWEGYRILVAGVVLVVAAVLVTDPAPGWEESVFRTVNSLTHSVEWTLWPLQQAGMALAVPVGAVILWLVVRHWRPPVGLVLGGIIFGWAAAKGLKEIVGRGRPGTLVDGVQFGYDVPVDGIGFPSGHAVVVFTLTVVFSPYLRSDLRWVLYGLAVVVMVVRVYVGAHMPLDVVGGAAFGTIVGSIVNLTAGIRADKARFTIPSR